MAETTKRRWASPSRNPEMPPRPPRAEAVKPVFAGSEVFAEAEGLVSPPHVYESRADGRRLEGLVFYAVQENVAAIIDFLQGKGFKGVELKRIAPDEYELYIPEPSVRASNEGEAWYLWETQLRSETQESISGTELKREDSSDADLDTVRQRVHVGGITRPQEQKPAVEPSAVASPLDSLTKALNWIGRIKNPGPGEFAILEAKYQEASKTYQHHNEGRDGSL